MKHENSLQPSSPGVRLAALLTASAMVAACAAVPAPSGDVPPAWVQGGIPAAYPFARYLTAVGVGDPGNAETPARELADQRARRELTLGLRARVRAEIRTASRVRGTLSRGGTDAAVDLEGDEITEVVGEGILDGARIVDRYTDPATRAVYSLVVLERSTAARNAAERLELELAEVEGTLASIPPDGDQPAWLPQLLGVHARYAKAGLGAETLRVLTGRELDPTLVERLRRRVVVRGRIEEALARVRLEVVEGDGQEVLLGGGLPSPVVVRATLETARGRVPISGLPLRLVPGSAEVLELAEEQVRTDPSGEARLVVHALHPAGRRTESVDIGVDLEGKLKGPTTRATFLVPTRESVRISVEIAETNGNRAVVPSSVGGAIEEALSAAGFAIQAGAGDLAVRGQAAAELGGRALGLPSARARATVEVVDVGSGRVLVSIQAGPAIDAHEDPQEAGRRSLRLLAQDVAAQVHQRLEAALGLP